MRNPSLILFLCGTLLAGCSSTPQPDVTQLAPWTRELRDRQPEEAFAAVYRWRGHSLVFVGASHSTRSDSPTFKLIADVYARKRFDTLIAEGFSYAAGPDAPRTLQWLQSQTETDGFVMGGESVPALRGAVQQHAHIWGGEPGDSVIRDRLLAEGISDVDLLGFYTLRSVPQWIREKRIADGGDPRVKDLVESELIRNRSRLGLKEALLPDYTAWAQWYERTNGQAFGSKFQLEEVGPLVDGDFSTNKLAAAVGRARDAFLLGTIADHLGEGENLLVVFGASHLMILRPALDRMLGAPCYVGGNMGTAPASCFE
ncbi:hypothetical protein FHS83_000602 [Rhizomicrobium palustre]|uniref:Uncharacterized protein n=1 Tax=Rhizomicrobium palustre TaxID=189966 RepID=A0A846MV08_9PROT|nr:hypothetical protein [Rhizomicrobium palustre]NIK87284.1 hypothetical protein [Rhizomicrobium palustre]